MKALKDLRAGTTHAGTTQGLCLQGPFTGPCIQGPCRDQTGTMQGPRRDHAGRTMQGGPCRDLRDLHKAS